MKICLPSLPSFARRLLGLTQQLKASILLTFALLLGAVAPSNAALVTQSQNIAIAQANGNQEYTFVYDPGQFVVGIWDDFVSSTYDTGLNFNFHVEIQSLALVGGTKTFGNVTMDNVQGRVSYDTFFNAGTSWLEPWAADVVPGMPYGPTTVTMKFFNINTANTSLPGAPGTLALTYNNTNPGGGTVPEPASLALAGLALAGLALTRRRQAA